MVAFKACNPRKAGPGVALPGQGIGKALARQSECVAVPVSRPVSPGGYCRANALPLVASKPGMALACLWHANVGML